MKKKTMKLLAVILSAAILLGSAPACADWPINNQIKGGGSAQFYPQSGQDLFYSARNCDRIQRPNANDYYSQPFTTYVSAPKGHSIYVYDRWEIADVHQTDTAFHGGRVTALAVHGDCSCILYETQDYQRKVGWARTSYLTPFYPGEESRIGYIQTPDPVVVGDPTLVWSRDFFVGTGRHYSILSEPIADCVNFTLDYQVTARNGAETSEVLGPRSVYVNDGSGWVFAGRFQYQSMGACHVNISLVNVMTVAAFAVIAECAKPDTFVCRQSLLDVKCLSRTNAPIQRRGPNPGTFSGRMDDYSPVPFSYARASSELWEGNILFSASYAIDASVNRPWVEGARGAGIGENLTLFFDRMQSIDILAVRLGYARNSDYYYMNNRPKDIRFSFSDGTSFDCRFSDVNQEHIVELNRQIVTDYVSMTILDVYSGSVDDTCIYLVQAYRAR